MVNKSLNFSSVKNFLSPEQAEEQEVYRNHKSQMISKVPIYELPDPRKMEETIATNYKKLNDKINMLSDNVQKLDGDIIAANSDTANNFSKVDDKLKELEDTNNISYSNMANVITEKVNSLSSDLSDMDKGHTSEIDLLKSELDSSKSYSLGAIGEVQNKISAANANIENNFIGNKNQFNRFRNEFDSHKSNIFTNLNNLKATTRANEATMSRHNESININKAEINDIREVITAINIIVDELKTTTDAIKTRSSEKSKEDSDRLRSLKEELKEDINDLNSKIQEFNNKRRDNKTGINNMEAEIAKIKTDINELIRYVDDAKSKAEQVEAESNKSFFSKSYKYIFGSGENDKSTNKKK